MGNGSPIQLKIFGPFPILYQKYEDLPNPGSKLKLPEGWKFRSVVLTQDLTVNGIDYGGKPNQWRVTQDDLINTYSACWEDGGQSSCNYKP